MPVMMMMTSVMIDSASGRDAVMSLATLTAAITAVVNMGVGMMMAMVVVVVAVTVTVVMRMVGSDGGSHGDSGDDDAYCVSCSNDFKDVGADVDGGGDSDHVNSYNDDVLVMVVSLLSVMITNRQ